MAARAGQPLKLSGPDQSLLG